MLEPSDFVATGQNQLWVADLTYSELRRRFVYLAAIIDAWSRKVVGYAIGNIMETRLTLAAFESACRTRHPGTRLDPSFRSREPDAAHAYRKKLGDMRIVGYMSRNGNPYDNAKAESFMKTLKH